MKHSRIGLRLAALPIIATLCAGGAVEASTSSLDPPLPDPIPAPIPFGEARVELQAVASGFAAPVTAAVAPGRKDTLFVGDQTGQIWAVDLKKGGKTLFADLSGRLIALGLPGFKFYDERGLLGLAFHPDFRENGLLYTFTSEPATGTADFSTMPAGAPPDCQNVLAEWKVRNPRARKLALDPNSRRELLRIDKPQLNHNGGSVQFGDDEMLYLSVGDGGAADDLAVGHAAGGNGQSLDPGNVLGKILRIDPTVRDSRNGQYGVPRDNPFLGRRGEPEIYAYGFRNPWRTSFDRKTGELYVGDVGQNDVEEIDVVERGGNYGWPVKEGTFLFANRDLCGPPRGPGAGCAFEDSPGYPLDLIDPIAEYDHADAPYLDREVRVAIVGGYVYRGERLDDLEGRYVFGDYSQEIGAPVAGHLFYLDRHDRIREIRVPDRIGADGKTALGLAVLGFGEDARGELYVLTNRSGTLADPDYVTFPGTSGEVFRLAPAPRPHGHDR